MVFKELHSATECKMFQSLLPESSTPSKDGTSGEAEKMSHTKPVMNVNTFCEDGESTMIYIEVLLALCFLCYVM